jgi:hypothetical protein
MAARAPAKALPVRSLPPTPAPTPNKMVTAAPADAPPTTPSR